MKRTCRLYTGLLWIVFLVISTSAVCQPNNRIVTLEGAIEEDMPFTMVLNIQGEEVLGYYYYHRYQTKILLEGTLEREDLLLNEAPNVMEPRAIFNGVMKGDQLTGTWSYTWHEEKLPFRAEVTDIKHETPSGTFTGSYRSTRESDDFLGDAALRFITDSTYYFMFRTATRSGCLGEIDDVIELNEEGKGTFADRLCEGITLSVEGDTLSVTQSFKCDYHGFFGCHFAGTYVKD